MKKKIYYASPFIIISVLVLTMDFLHKIGLIEWSPYILFASLILTSIIFGNLSPTNKKFDYVMTAIVPLSFFLLMFVVGFLDKDDLETRFHLYKAFRAAFQPSCLLKYLIMALTTFLASFKPIRIIKWDSN